MCRPVSAVPGDVLVLTKPLGTRVAVNAHVMLYNKEKEKKLLENFSKEEIISLYNSSIDSMVRLNRKAAQLMHKYKAHAATDVTGFGILGHANQLASNQKACVKFEIHTLPCFANALRVNDVFDYGLKTGYSAETSGGLLISISRENAPMLIKELHELEGWPAFVVGEVFERVGDSEPYAYLSNESLFVEVMDPHA
ncbi:Selenide, water dikinase [Zancudomyces culisetae]|uniref:Selenide, water dikinase n=1 Tax=Zancudomyces culisetae TaxID=1213189 RepID=A0A1R1PXB5_ZANCU|nr:Selenide, water dikinase [Zancudomyces culisetae]|eukprot:OMH85573.1 Selenide, water dikinase [Zancudomyces culisetae]